MRNKNKLLISIATFGCLFATIGIALKGNLFNSFSLSRANNSHFTFIFDYKSSCKMTSSEAAAETCVRNTKLGNPITLNFNNCATSSANYFTKLSHDGYVRNLTPLTGIEKITIVASHRQFTVSLGNTYGSYSSSQTFGADESTSMRTFVYESDGTAKYFSIENSLESSNTITYIESVEVTYSCGVTSELLEYNFDGDEASLPGYGEGKIYLNKSLPSGSRVKLCWGDSSGVALDKHYPLYEETLSSAKNSLSVDIGENVTIPKDAKKVLAYENDFLVGTYDIPISKQLNETLKHKFAVLSDVHGNCVQGQKHLENALNVLESKDVEYIVISGDLGESDADYQAYSSACKDSNFDGLIFASMGNHDQTAQGRVNFKNHAIYDGKTNTFVSISEAPAYFKDTYDGDLNVSVYYQDVEGSGNTNYYYATIEDNMYFFMDQMLSSTSNTALQDNFSRKQLRLLESVLMKYSGTHVVDDEFNYTKYSLNIVEHSPFTQLKVGDRFEGGYGAQLSTNPQYKNNKYFLDLAKEYTEMNWFTGHTHVQYDLGINYIDKLYNEFEELTDTDIAHLFHVSSCAQPRWYEGKSMMMPNDFSSASEGYVAYQYENSTVFEGNSFKELNKDKTTYDILDYSNHIYPLYSYIVPNETKSHSPVSGTDYAIAENGQVRVGNPTWSDTVDGLEVNFAATTDRFEIKMGDQSARSNSDCLVFLYKSSDITTFTLGGCNYTGGRYTIVDVDLSTSSPDCIVDSLYDGWYQVVIPMSKIFYHEVGSTFALRFYNPNASGKFFIKELVVSSDYNVQQESCSETSNWELMQLDDGWCNGTKAAFTGSEVFGSSSLARKFTFKNSLDNYNSAFTGSDDSTQRAYIAFAPEFEFGSNNGINIKDKKLSFDVKFSQEFFNSTNMYKHMLTITFIDTGWTHAPELWGDWVPNGKFGFYYDNSSGGWFHYELDLSSRSEDDILTGSLLRIRIGLFGLTEVSKQTASLVIDNFKIS